MPTAPASTSPASPPAAPDEAQNHSPALILLSFDGWRWDYDRKAPTPNLHRLMARGVRAERLIPSFPSKTFPNHYTVVTGLYPGDHGIIANNMWDEAMGQHFGLDNRDAVGDARWWGGEPIWVTAMRQGLRTATLFWPGSEAPIGGMRPNEWSLYDAKITNAARVERILGWLDRPEVERPRLITGYFSDADDAGHDFGPESPQLREALTRVDTALGALLDGLASRGLTDRVNIVITSDHGMAETRSDRTIVVDDYLDEYLAANTIEIVDINPTLGIVMRGADVDVVYRRLTHAHPHLRVYRKAETPLRWHYRDNPRVPAIVGVADEGWMIRRRPRPRPAASQGEHAPAPAASTPVRISGTHGYDPEVRSMHGLFVAAGPSFRRGVVVPAFQNINIYNALAAALQVQPAKNDGDPAIARRLLATSESVSTSWNTRPPTPLHP